MRVLLVTEVRIYVINNKYYASESFTKILQRYQVKFKEITLLTRLIAINQIPNGYKDITNCCIRFENSKSIVKSFLPFGKENIKKLVCKSDFIILRVPSIISISIYKYIRKFHKKYMTEAMGCAWDAYWNHDFLGKIVALYGFISMKKIVYNADYATYVTQEFLQKRYPCKNKSIGVSNVSINEINYKRNYENNPKKEITLLTAAAVDVRYKGQHLVIKAISKIKKNNKINIKYYLAGSGNQEFLKRMAKKYNVSSNVVFLGNLSHNELLELMKKTDIYVQPSLQEGLPRSLIEAMSCGCVCLGSTTAGIPELLQTNCLFKRGSEKELYYALKNIIYEDWKEISKNNLKKASLYLETNLDKKRFDYYEKIKTELSI